MSAPFLKLIAFAILLIAPALGEPATPTRSKPVPAPERKLRQQPVARSLGNLPLVFEPNLGQTDPQVRFLTRAAGVTAFLTDRENVMVWSRGEEQAVVRMQLEGARAPHRFEGLDKAESYSNYFIGNDPSKWRPNVPHYRKVRAYGVYAGIDLVYYGDGRKLEYDFVVKPGADPSRIRLSYQGADSLRTDAQGNLLIATRHGTLIQRKPLVYQEWNGERHQIEASYSIRGGRVEFAIAKWDRQRELVIDPVLVLDYSTYLGGNGSDSGNGIAVDAGGAAYVVGETASTNFPLMNPRFQPTFPSWIPFRGPAAAALTPLWRS